MKQYKKFVCLTKILSVFSALCQSFGFRSKWPKNTAGQRERWPAVWGVHIVFQIGRLAGAEEGMKKLRTARRARRRHMDRRNCSPGTQELCSCQLQKAVQSVSRFAVSGKSSQQNGFSRQTLRRAYPMPHPAAFAFKNSIVVLCGLRQFPWHRFSEKPQKIAHFFALNIYHIIYAARLFICLIS